MENAATLIDVAVWVLIGVFALAVLFGVVFGGAFWMLRRMALQKEAGARARYPQALKIDRAASFFGQESLGPTQMRGNGTLILTDSELIFELWVPGRTFRVPLANIQALETPTSHLGKTRFAALLKVVFTDAQAATDSMAWQVRDLGDWLSQIRASQSRHRPEAAA